MATFNNFSDLQRAYESRTESRILTNFAYAVIAFAALYFGGHVVLALVW